MSKRRPDRQASLTFAPTIDLIVLDAFDAPLEAGALAREYLVGRTVTVRVGGMRPTDLDPRIPELLAEALDYGVGITLDAVPWRLHAWAEAINEHRGTAPQRRLRAVRR